MATEMQEKATETLERLKEGDIVPSGPWEGLTVLSIYTRAEAIEDGMLIDLTGLAQSFGFRVPVAMTATVWEWCAEVARRSKTTDNITRIPLEARSVAGLVLCNLYRAIKRGNASDDGLDLKIVFFGCEKVIRSTIGPGDDGEAVLTIMEPGEE